jgi:hypothetical protein
MAKGKELPDAVKVFIVQRLACWDTPSQVSASVKDEFGIDLPRQNIHVYDPTVKAGANLSLKLRTLFEETRETFTTETASIGIAHKSVRLRALDRMAKVAEGRGNILGAAQLLEQAAKECGGSFTNKHELTGPNGIPLAAPTATIVFGSAPPAAPASEAADGSGKPRD